MDQIPAQIENYRILGRLGSGGCAVVWLAHDVDLDSRVAIKVLAEAWNANPIARQQFKQEARLLRRLEHERILSVYEVAELPDGRPYFVMQYADRGSLYHRIAKRVADRRPFAVPEALGLSLEVAEGLVAAHDLQVVHCDLKPGNVLFRSIPPERQDAMRRDGLRPSLERVVLADLGIGRRLSEAFAGTQVLGTPAYMAPEQMNQASGPMIEFRTDVYSAAVILYELLAGRPPYPYQTIGEVRQAMAAGPPPPLAAFRPDVPPWVVALVDTGLARDPLRRPPNARAWRAMLRDALRARPVAPAR